MVATLQAASQNIRDSKAATENRNRPTNGRGWCCRGCPWCCCRVSRPGSRCRPSPLTGNLGGGEEVKGKRSKGCCPRICAWGGCAAPGWSCDRRPCSGEWERRVRGGNLQIRVRLEGRGSRSFGGTRRRRWRWEGSRISDRPCPEEILSFRVAVRWEVETELGPWTSSGAIASPCSSCSGTRPGWPSLEDRSLWRAALASAGSASVIGWKRFSKLPIVWPWWSSLVLVSCFLCPSCRRLNRRHRWSRCSLYRRCRTCCPCWSGRCQRTSRCRLQNLFPKSLKCRTSSTIRRLKVEVSFSFGTWKNGPRSREVRPSRWPERSSPSRDGACRRSRRRRSGGKSSSQSWSRGGRVQSGLGILNTEVRIFCSNLVCRKKRSRRPSSKSSRGRRRSRSIWGIFRGEGPSVGPRPCSGCWRRSRRRSATDIWHNNSTLSIGCWFLSKQKNCFSFVFKQLGLLHFIAALCKFLLKVLKLFLFLFSKTKKILKFFFARPYRSTRRQVMLFDR